MKRWWERLEKRQVAREYGGDETGDETGGPEDETGDKTAATAGDERDGGDRWGYTDCCCARWPGQPSIIDPVTNAANAKKALCI